MSQIFHPSSNSLAKGSIIVLGLLVCGVIWAAYAISGGSYTTRQEVVIDQPVMFSHARHVGGNGIDCRYCHTSVEESGFAGIPPTETCMTCHSQILTDAPMLEPIRASYRSGEQIKWVRVHDLPDFVYFNHSIHVTQGVACVTCHGQVDKMPLMWKQNTLTMQWCLDCHRQPERFIRPREHVFDMNWKLDPKQDQLTLGTQLVKDYNINVKQLTNCSICHR